jgi:hypothetical protein
LTRRATDENSVLAGRKQSIYLCRLQLGNIAPNEKSVIIVFKRVTTGFVRVYAGYNVETLEPKAMREPPRATE